MVGSPESCSCFTAVLQFARVVATAASARTTTKRIPSILASFDNASLGFAERQVPDRYLRGGSVSEPDEHSTFDYTMTWILIGSGVFFFSLIVLLIACAMLPWCPSYDTLCCSPHNYFADPAHAVKGCSEVYPRTDKAAREEEQEEKESETHPAEQENY